MNLLFLTLLFPLLGFLLLAFANGRWSEKQTALIGVGSIGLSALTTLWILWQFTTGRAIGVTAFDQVLWSWMAVEHFNVVIRLFLDGLSLTMLSVVTGVGFLIHLFASWYMRGEEGYSRFFAYTNLFIAFMIILVLADDLLLLYLGWEGVGLCSYLLIGFYYSDAKNGAAAMKAFIVTRIGDVFLAIGMFILYQQFGTLNIRILLEQAPEQLAVGSATMEWAALLLLGGAVGKSAQLPLQTWLADAMAGPTPVSALIHAATMVTAGVYLIARTYGLFLLAPDILHWVAMIGGITLLLAGFAALVQTDIKRILAYSTMSQIGYMFLALGVQAWDAAIFHLMTHAFFKALLFLAAGSVIVATHHEQNIFKMGGLRKSLPLTYAAFLIGGAALVALPWVSAGFFSKERILWGVLVQGETLLLGFGLIGAFMTALYTFRLIFVVFHGKEQLVAVPPSGLSHHIPLIVLMVFSTFIGGMIPLPLAEVLPAMLGGDEQHKIKLEVLSILLALAGTLLAAWLYLGKRTLVTKIAEGHWAHKLSVWWRAGWGFDQLYDWVFVRPYLWVSQILRPDPLDRLMNSPARLTNWSNRQLLFTENGQLRWYAASMGAGAVLLLVLLLLV